MKAKLTKVRKILSSNLKKYREKLGLSQEKLAENAEISTMMVKDLESITLKIRQDIDLTLKNALNLCN